MPPIKRSDYKTGKEYRWARKAQAKEQTAGVRALIWLAAIALIPVWIATGSFIAGVAAGAGLILVVIGLIVLFARAKAV